MIELYAEPPKKKYATKKFNPHRIVDTWSLDILSSKDYRPENNRGYRYVFVVTVNFNNFRWTVPLKAKRAKTITNSTELILSSSELRQISIERPRKRFFKQNL